METATVNDANHVDADAGREAQKEPGEMAPGRLHALVAELLTTNEALRLRIAALEENAEAAERGLRNATRWAGLL
jgi:hypothetical protein